MKKIFKILTAAVVLAGGLFLTSCDSTSDWIAPKDTWVYKSSTKSDNSFTYKSSDGSKSVSFDLYVNYATKDSTVTFKDSTADVKTGMNVILVPQTKTDAERDYLKELLEASNIDDIAIFYSYGTSSAAANSDDSSTEGKTIDLGTFWTVIYNFNNFESMGTKSMSNTTANLTKITDLKNLNVKKVLYNMIGDKIFDEN